MIKELQYSFPSSDNAREYGYYKDGCYTVHVNSEVVKVFPTNKVQDAIDYYFSLPHETGIDCLVPWWRKYGVEVEARK